MARPAPNRLVARTDVYDFVLPNITQPEHFTNAFRQLPESPFAFSQSFLRPFALGYILACPFVVEHLAIRIPHNMRVHTDPNPASVFAVNLILKAPHLTCPLKSPL